MDDASQLAPPYDTIAETALGVLNARKNTNQAMANTSSLYQEGNDPLSFEGRNEVLEHEPAYMIVNQDEFEDDKKSNYKEVNVLTALNGLPANSAEQVEQMISFVGFARSETANEHMKDNANGTFPLKVHGVLTTIHTGITDIRGGALVRIRAPTEEEARLQHIVGRRSNKKLLMTEEYRPELDAVDKKNAFVSLMMSLGEKLEPREREITSFQAQIYADWWKAKRTQFVVFLAEMVHFEKISGGATKVAAKADAIKSFRTYAKSLGLVPGDNGNVEMQKSLLKRLFVMNVFSRVAQPDVMQTFFSSPRSATGPQAVTQTEFAITNEFYQLQISAIQHEQNAIISGHAKVWNSIIGKAPTGAIKGQKLDLVMFGLTG